MKNIRIVMADDHDIVLEGLRRVLNSPEYDVVGTAFDGQSLVRVTDELRPDVIITDITMPLLNGIDAARKIRKAQPKARIIFLTMHPDIAYASEALSLGNCGYVLKTAAGDELETAIHAVVKGEAFVTPRIAATVLEHSQKRGSGKPRGQLSAREREILQLIAEGRTFKEIASVLGISPRTVEFHRNRLAEKTGQKTMAALTRYAVRIGVVSELGGKSGGVLPDWSRE